MYLHHDVLSRLSFSDLIQCIYRPRYNILDKWAVSSNFLFIEKSCGFKDSETKTNKKIKIWENLFLNATLFWIWILLLRKSKRNCFFFYCFKIHFFWFLLFFSHSGVDLCFEIINKVEQGFVYTEAVARFVYFFFFLFF